MINSVKGKSILFCMACCLLVASCANSAREQQHVPFQTVEKGSVSPTQLAGGVHVLRTAAEWRDFWSALKASIVPQPPLPEVDFIENVVIAVVDQSRSTGGYSIAITQLTTSAAGMAVHAVHQSPGRDCLVTQALEQPYHIVTTPAFPGEATIYLTETVLDCSKP